MADRLFEELRRATSIRLPLSACLKEEDQSSFFVPYEAGASGKHRELGKALHDIVCAVKRNSYERDSAQLRTDVAALNRVIAGKKQLEELAKTHISLE
ncbi:MAG: hypothetical protein ACLURV_01495 [Gallintestinimicrobium sp.]